MSRTIPSARPPLAPRPRVTGVSIVIPAYNEQGSIGATIERVSAAASSLGAPCQIIVVNDGSRDGTGTVVRSLQTRIPRLELVEHYPNRGYGGSLRAGFAVAAYDWIAFLPGDNQFDPMELSRFIERASEADIVSGYRADRQDAAIRKLNAFGWHRGHGVLRSTVPRHRLRLRAVPARSARARTRRVERRDD